MKHANRVIFGIVFHVLAFSAVSGAASASTMGGPSLTDVPAGQCEIFVERVGVGCGSYRQADVYLYLKANLAALDGRPVRAGFMATVYDVENQCAVWPHSYCSAVGTWQAWEGTSFFGATDYWALKLPIFPYDLKWEGAFFVETDKGTRYWMNARTQPNFIIDVATYSQVSARFTENTGVAPSCMHDWQETLLTATDFAELNPQRCQ